MKKTLFIILLFVFGIAAEAQTTVSFNPSQDNTLYQNGSGSLSNGSGTQLFSGRTRQSSGSLRRALVQFDLSSIPANAVITSASLRISVNKQRGGIHTHNIHAVTSPWGEGTSNAAGNEGGGTTAAAGDATWIHSRSPGQLWNTAGGDFNPISSASSTISGNGNVTFSSTQLVADVQRWADSATTNNGWIIIGVESTTGTAKRFASRENGVASARPTLTITYTISTSLEEREKLENLNIYPNPTKNYFVVDNSFNVIQPNVVVYDMSGKVVKNELLQMDNKINVGDLNPGIYFIELVSSLNGDRIRKKIIKQ